MTDPTTISLVDNTIPSQQPSGEPSRQTSNDGLKSSLSSRASVSGHRAKRKYAKWQPDRLGVAVAADASAPPSRESSRPPGSISGESSTGPLNETNPQSDLITEATRVDTSDFASRVPSKTAETVQSGSIIGGPLQQPDPDSNPTKPIAELDVLYENQRGSFFFGVPLYSHSSLLNFDPSAWMTQDKRPSPVNITNAQLPDPSWEWSWRTWYVDMSGDVDEQGWQYSFSFGSSQWHGTHPWFHSYVRRRRWIRLRTKIPEKRHKGASEFDRAHDMNADYFTIHSSRARSREQSVTGLSRVESGFLSRVSTTLDEGMHLEEIGDIPSLMYALKSASIDRERLDALKRFVEEGGEELYYLNDKIPEVMSTFLFQASRWQFVTYLVKVIHVLSKTVDEPGNKDADRVKRKKDNLIRAVENAKQHVTGPDVFIDTSGGSTAELFDLTPVSRHDSLLSKRASVTDEPLHVMRRKEIKGIPQAAEVGREGHIY